VCRVPTQNHPVAVPPTGRPPVVYGAKGQYGVSEFGVGGAAIEPKVRDMILAASDGRDLFAGVGLYERTRPNGAVLEVRTTPLPAGGIVRTYSDISDRKRDESLIAHSVRHDSLTGLANRRHLLESMEALLDGVRMHGEHFALFFVDLDRFKPINEYGHAVGDAMLEAVADGLRSVVEKGDILARLGGDEFAVLKRDIRSRRTANRFAVTLIRRVAEPVRIGREVLGVGASVGISLAPRNGSDARTLLQRADVALYRAKRADGNGFVCFENKMEDC
jgi:diguanylate cyclase (GGDEF)-like protein